MVTLLKTSIAVLNHRIVGLLTGCQSEIPCPAPCPWPMRMKYAEMNRPNNEVITARNTHKAMRAGGTPTSPTSPRAWRKCTLDPCRSHDRVLKRLIRKNHTITPVMSAPNATQIFMKLFLALRVPDRRQLVGWDVLRDEILFGAGHAVVVGPAVNDRQSLAPVTVLGRCIGRLPFERRGPPGIAARVLAFEK